MTSRERVKRILNFETPDRFAYNFPEPFGSDFNSTSPDPSPDKRLRQGKDLWGCIWQGFDYTNLGEVTDSPLKNWDDFHKLTIPSLDMEGQWDRAKAARAVAPDKYIIGMGVSLYERVHFVRGLENTWCDILEEPENLSKFINLLADMNIEILHRYAEYGIDGIMNLDDWGLQNRLMIDPAAWRRLWKPAYKRVYSAAKSLGLSTWLHSCGYIVDIIDDLIEIGLDVLQLDQQENMGLENLQQFRGQVTFYTPVDIQAVMPKGDTDEIRMYCRKMFESLGTKAGGFIPCWYSDPIGAGHSRESIDAMCNEFINISHEIYGK